MSSDMHAQTRFDLAYVHAHNDVDHILCSFHETQPMDGLELYKTQEERCMKVLRPDITTVPYPLLGENTLVISDTLVLSPGQDGKPRLQVRVG